MRNVLTLIAAPGDTLDDDAIAAAHAILGRPGHAVEIRRLGPDAADLAFAGPPDGKLDGKLEATLRSRLPGIDLAIQPEAGRRKRLLVADMDSTIVVGETLDEIAAEAGIKEHVAAITARAMNGELDFKAALRERVGLLAGLDAGALERVYARVEPMSGARALVRTMRANGAATLLVSGGFRYFTGRIAARLGFDADHANDLEIEGGRLTGRVVEPILDRDAKLASLKKGAAARGLGLEATLAVGDGANDLPMLLAAGLGVAYHAKPTVAAAARVRVDHGDLTALLYLQGYRRDEFIAD